MRCVNCDEDIQSVTLPGVELCLETSLLFYVYLDEPSVGLDDAEGHRQGWPQTIKELKAIETLALQRFRSLCAVECPDCGGTILL